MKPWYVAGPPIDMLENDEIGRIAFGKELENIRSLFRKEKGKEERSWVVAKVDAEAGIVEFKRSVQ